MKLSTFNFQLSILFLAVFLCFQSVSAQTSTIGEEARKEIREKIGLDYSMPDYSIGKIDVNVMGPRLAGILEYLLENYTQGTYDRLLTRMQGEQVEELKQAYFNIKKMKFVSASKKGNE